MSLIRPTAAVLCASFALTGTALAQDDDGKGETGDKVEEIVEERAAEEARDGEPADADVGEASYNTENCAPANGEKGEAAEGSGAESDETDAAGGDSEDADSDGRAADVDGDAAAGTVEQGAIDECEQLIK